MTAKESSEPMVRVIEVRCETCGGRRDYRSHPITDGPRSYYDVEDGIPVLSARFIRTAPWDCTICGPATRPMWVTEPVS